MKPVVRPEDFGLSPITLPTSEPLTLDQAKGHLRIDPSLTEYDADITAFIAVARNFIEDNYNVRIERQEWEYTLQYFPKADRIRLPLHPVRNVTYFRYTGTDGTQYTMNIGSDLLMRLKTKPAELILPFGGVWPGVVLNTAEGIQIGMELGWDDDSPIVLPRPAQVDQAMKLLIGNFFELRGAVSVGRLNVTSDVTFGVDSLMSSVRLY